MVIVFSVCWAKREEALQIAKVLKLKIILFIFLKFNTALKPTPCGRLWNASLNTVGLPFHAEVFADIKIRQFSIYISINQLIADIHQ